VAKADQSQGLSTRAIIDRERFPARPQNVGEEGRMKEYKIIKCKGCGKLFKILPLTVYKGDPEYCPKCNREVCKGDNDWVKGASHGHEGD